MSLDPPMVGDHNPVMTTIPTHVYVVRHAWAEDVGPDGDDFSRPLTKKGRRRFEKFISHLRDAGMQVGRIAASPLVRTRETAEIMAEVFGLEAPIDLVDALAPGANWRALVEWTIRQDTASVAWVGHAPCVGRLVALTIGDGSAAIRMQKGAVASLRLDDGPGHPGELEWLATAGVVEGE
jgi:phosphohistidine phosphatase